VADNAVPDLTSTRIDTNNPAAVRASLADYLGTDRDLNMLIDSVSRDWPTVLDAAIVDVNGKVILHTRPELIGKQVADRPDFALVEDASFRRKLQLLYKGAALLSEAFEWECRRYF
jgi:hypothetical protein